jgi:hypothetical protein
VPVREADRAGGMGRGEGVVVEEDTARERAGGTKPSSETRALVADGHVSGAGSIGRLIPLTLGPIFGVQGYKPYFSSPGRVHHFLGNGQHYWSRGNLRADIKYSFDNPKREHA